MPLSLEVGQLAMEVAAVVEPHVGEREARRAAVEHAHTRRRAVALVVVAETDRRAVVVARVGRLDATDQLQSAAHLHRRVVRQQIYTPHTYIHTYTTSLPWSSTIL